MNAHKITLHIVGTCIYLQQHYTLLEFSLPQNIQMNQFVSGPIPIVISIALPDILISQIAKASLTDVIDVLEERVIPASCVCNDACTMCRSPVWFQQALQPGPPNGTSSSLIHSR